MLFSIGAPLPFGDGRASWIPQESGPLVVSERVGECQAWRVCTLGCLFDRDFHSFAGQHRVGEPFLAQLFNPAKELVVVVGVVMGEGEAFYAGHFSNLHGLIKAAVSPTASLL